MKTQIWVYAVVAVLSIGAGVAIAGVPSSEPREPTIQAPTTVESTVLTNFDDTATSDSDALESASESSSDEATVDTSEAIDDDADAASTTTSEPVESTTTVNTTTTTTVPIPERDAVRIAAVNGAGAVGLASANADTLIDLGYTQMRALDGSVLVDVSVIYAVEGLGPFAERLADELGLDPNLVFPFADAPGVPSLQDEELIVYLGFDAVPL